MTEHPTLEPTALDRTASDRTATTVSVRAGGPSSDAVVAFVDLVCADRELLAAEFDAIITANFPDPAGGPQPRDRSVPALTGTDRVPPRRARHRCSLRLLHSARTVAQHLEPRERGPPPRNADTANGSTGRGSTVRANISRR